MVKKSLKRVAWAGLILFVVFAGTWVQAQSCTNPEDCDDGNPCTDDSCTDNLCVYTHNTDPCDDGDVCTMEDTCDQGVCSGVALDHDRDGYVSDLCAGDDCNDQDYDIHPGMVEGSHGDPLCSDGVDNDCDGLSDALDRGCAVPGEMPNVVIFFTDDQGYQDLGSYGSPLIETPVIDQLAVEGVRFTSFYAGASTCTASRAALMTGCYPARVGLDLMIDPIHNSHLGLNPEETTIAELLKAQGYETAMMGKWHLGNPLEFFPTRQGFDFFLGIPYSNDMLPVPLYRNEEWIEDLGLGNGQEELTRMYTDEAIQFITDNQDNPFFVYIAYAMPHVPLHASDDFEGTSARGLYGDVIEEIDFHVGRIRNTLETLKLDVNTLVIFTSDNGPWLEKGNDAGSADPFVNGKGTHWEGGFRVPCVMWWPGTIPAGQVNGEIIALIDFYPTIAALAGAELPTGQIDGVDIVIDGKNVWPLMSGQPGATSPHEAFYYDLGAVRSGKWKLMDGRLYDLENDPHEDNDLSSLYPQKVLELWQMLFGFNAELSANQRPFGGFLDPVPDWTQASVTGSRPSSLSGVINRFLFFVLPPLAVILWRIRRKGKKQAHH